MIIMQSSIYLQKCGRGKSQMAFTKPLTHPQSGHHFPRTFSDSGSTSRAASPKKTQMALNTVEVAPKEKSKVLF